MISANPYLNFAGNTEEAFEFYRSVFGGDFMGVTRYGDFGDNTMGIPEEDLDRIAHICLPIGDGNMLMGTDALKSLGQSLTVGNNFYLHLEGETAEEAERLFGALAERVQMPLQGVEWAERYGMCADRFGVQWMVSYTGVARLSGTTP